MMSQKLKRGENPVTDSPRLSFLSGMRRTLFVTLITVAIAACGRAESRGRSDSAIAQADSARADSLQDSTTEDQDLPCFASHLGLPCR
jgi:hypothetical protein